MNRWIRRFARVVPFALVGLFGYCVGRSQVPYLQAEIALREAIATASTRTIPPTVKLRLPPDLASPEGRPRFTHAYRP